MTTNDIEERFDYPMIVAGDHVVRINDLMKEFRNVAVSLYADCGDNRELTIAMERLEESANWAIKSILKDEYDDNDDESIYPHTGDFL